MTTTAVSATDEHRHVFQDSFPRNDEYDFMALEPETPYGTPYGGFSRATASRLAALPLRLPSVSSDESGGGNGDDENEEKDDDDEEEEEDEPLYTFVRDHFGRQFACRSYYEDELDPESLGDSMFDTPRLKKEKKDPSKTKPKPTGDPPPSSSSSETEDPNPSGTAGATEEIPVDATAAAPSPTQPARLSEMGFDPIMVGHTIHQRLAKLTGLCAQLHPPAWWSYEWCHQESVKQFHVKVVKTSSGAIQKFELESITSLGSYSKRIINVDRDADGEKKNDPPKKEDDLAQGRRELGRVVDTFVGGDVCTETGLPRVTEATFRCCSRKHLTIRKGGVLKDGNQVDTDLIAVHDATEDPDRFCHYNITLCTPLLCDDYEDDDDAGGGRALYRVGGGGDASSSSSRGSGSAGSTTTTTTSSWGEATEKAAAHQQSRFMNLDLDPSEAETMSVREILEWTFPDRFCLRAQTAGWWSYEFCPGAYVRQYHEDEPSVDSVTNAITAALAAGGGGEGGQPTKKKPGVTEFYLGRYLEEDHPVVDREDDWKHVVNATTTTNAADSRGGSSSSFPSPVPSSAAGAPSASAAGGNGARYVQEYTGGDVCDHEDVTDSAVKAGEFGEGKIERAVTVRYSCLEHLSITVKEDSTCHYIADVTLPTLCHHPLFRPPVSKKQVVKCLPVP
eukprot:CAMPEP_0197176478 /NCGR_PEP_ID=MMETSP1423-20130617/2394_1 /TAXON_ID=476441 /ORGANISM="Pseudo-nitzschia heimii, Strain UNC1101" /LENGTH=675 /DNA_ID=CAMNT_0042625859 /DNA_START=11 /DNA_END=2038 /DNA_ORIENTATION=+